MVNIYIKKIMSVTVRSNAFEYEVTISGSGDPATGLVAQTEFAVYFYKTGTIVGDPINNYFKDPVQSITVNDYKQGTKEYDRLNVKNTVDSTGILTISIETLITLPIFDKYAYGLISGSGYGASLTANTTFPEQELNGITYSKQTSAIDWVLTTGRLNNGAVNWYPINSGYPHPNYTLDPSNQTNWKQINASGSIDQTILLTDINFTNYGAPEWETIREAYLKAESVYLSAKNTYQAILDNPEIDLGFTEAHYPAKFKHLITRAEQFLNTTVTPALEYTSRSNLTSLYARYSELNSVINQIKSIYPNIQIDEGDEATPY